MKLLITGGHLTPALAIIDEILADNKKNKKNKPVKMVFVGRKFSQQEKRSPSFEFQEIKRRNIPFYNLNAGRITRTVSLSSLLHLFRMPIGFYQAWRILWKEKPDIILSFGGYLAVPIALVGAAMKIRIYTHEQTVHPGLANRLIGRVAKTIFISFPESAPYFNRQKVILSGNPIRKQVFEVDQVPFHLTKSYPIIYITGGSLGSHAINVHIKNILPELLEKYIVIHQTGNVKQFNDFATLSKIKDQLPAAQAKRYFLKEHFLSNEIGYIFKVADLVISRSGANTFFELLEMRKPALFVPLPFSAHNEQQKQAEIFKDKGVGEIFPQSDSSDHLLTFIYTMMKNIDKYKANFKNFRLSYSTHAVKIIATYIFNS